MVGMGTTQLAYSSPLRLVSAAALVMLAAACSEGRVISGVEGGGNTTGGSTTSLGAGGGSSSSSSSSSSSGAAEPCGAPTSSSTLPGVHIDITSAACTLSLSDPGPGLVITYDLVVEQDGIVVLPAHMDAGGCNQPGPAGLIPLETVSGAGQGYCLCDVGYCMGTPLPATTLTKGTYPFTFTWSGHDFYGPSDTGNQPGALFPPGTYALSVVTKGATSLPGGGAPFEVRADWVVHVVP
jgi:hypothetical protein